MTFDPHEANAHNNRGRVVVDQACIDDVLREIESCEEFEKLFGRVPERWIDQANASAGRAILNQKRANPDVTKSAEKADWHIFVVVA